MHLIRQYGARKTFLGVDTLTTFSTHVSLTRTDKEISFVQYL